MGLPSPDPAGSPPRKAARLLPTVHRLRLPEGPPVVGVELVPRMMQLHTAQDAFTARWLRCALDGHERVPVGHELFYTPTTEDVLHRLRLEVTPRCLDGTPIAKNIAAVESTAVIDEFSPCAARTLVRHSADDGDAAPFARVLTYNVLSQRAATRQIFPHCPEWALRWPFRWRAIRRGLVSADADIASLQEVEADAWDTHFEPALLELGYAGILAPKRTRRGGLTHGCATLYRPARWEVVAQRVVTLADTLDAFLAQRKAGATGVPAALADEARGKGTLVLLVALRARARTASPAGIGAGSCSGDDASMGGVGAVSGGTKGLVLANSHLHWEAHRPQLKALQALLVCCAAATFRDELGSRAEWPLVLAADLNSTPTIEQGCTDGARVSAPPLVHSLSLESAYQRVLGREPDCTNFTPGFVGTIDYIWLERDGVLRASAVLDVPDRAELAAHGGLPSCVHPSDHLPLVATLSLACRQ